MQSIETVYESGSTSSCDKTENINNEDLLSAESNTASTGHLQNDPKYSTTSPTTMSSESSSSARIDAKSTKESIASDKKQPLKSSQNDNLTLVSSSQNTPSPMSAHKRLNDHSSINFRATTPGSASSSSLTSIATNSSSRGDTNQSSRGSQQLTTCHQNPSFDSNVITERVKNLATQIYQELKRIISRYKSDENIFSGLMPLIVRVLESLDHALNENQQLHVDLELCRDDNEQLVIMIEKEKNAKRGADKKLIETEYAFEGDRQKFQQKIEALDSMVKKLELKFKNASDQASRFEEKDIERKSEYNKLHDRYTELLKSHCDVVERVRHLVGNDSGEMSSFDNVHVSHTMVASNSDLTGNEPPLSFNKMKVRSNEADLDKTPTMRRGDFLSSTKSWNTDTELTLEDTSLVILDDQALASCSSIHPETSSECDTDHDRDGDKDSIAYTSMEKEFRKLIQENKDLLNTKNALNVVKDDLIAEVDRLSNEVTMYEQAVEQLNGTKDELKQKVSGLDNELKKTKEELEKAKQKIRENNEEGVPYASRKRFGRAEMAKVLMERNNYKERLMELQDAVKYTELVRANKHESEKTSWISKFFNNLFGAPLRDPLAIGGPGMALSYSSNPMHAQAVTEKQFGVDTSNRSLSPDSLHGSGALVRNSSILSTNQRLTSNSDFVFLMDSDLSLDRNRALNNPRLMESTGYVHAYGWNLSVSSIKGIDRNSLVECDESIANSTINSVLNSATSPIKPPSAFQVPIPQYCRPLKGDTASFKIWCGTSIDLSGGDAATNNEIQQQINLGQDNSTSQILSRQTELTSTSQQVNRINKSHLFPAHEDSENASSCVWICSTQHSKSKVSIIDIKTQPDDLLAQFLVPSFVYCIKAIPGVKQSDLPGINREDKHKLIGADAGARTIDTLKELIAIQQKPFYTLVELEPDINQILFEKIFSKHQSSTDTQSSLQMKDASLNSKQEEISQILDRDTSIGTATLQKLNDFVAYSQSSSSQLTEDKKNTSKVLGPELKPEPETKIESEPTTSVEANTSNNQEVHCKDMYQPFSTVLPTVWMGGKDRVLYVHSAMGQWKDCIGCIKLSDSILRICHFRGRVFVALADGSLCVFMRNIETKQWNFDIHLKIDIDLLCEATKDCDNFTSAHFEGISAKLYGRKKNQQDNISNITSGSLVKTDKTIQDANNSQQTTRSCDVPKNSSSIPEMSIHKRREKLAGIRCLEIANKNLWVGYKNQVLIIDPITFRFKHTFGVVPQVDNQVRQIVSFKDGVFICLRSDLVLRLYSSIKPYNIIRNIDIEPAVARFISPKTFVISHITAMKVVNNSLWIGNAHGIILTIPFKLVPLVSENPTSEELDVGSGTSKLSIAHAIPEGDVANAQISFHGHKDAVKFFIHSDKLMLSGGQGYLDFRLDMEDQSKSMSERGHLIIWQLW